jgi:ribonuclease HIII
MKSWIGTDESGKGSYFGPLVVAGVYVTEKSAAGLKEAGVRDSKRLGRGTLHSLAEVIRENYLNSVVFISPRKYNELYPRMKNLNSFLVWAHRKAIKNILKKVECKYVIIDDFGSSRILISSFPEIELDVRPRAEDDTAVAAASILARDEFLNWIEKSSILFKTPLPIGINEETIRIGKSLIKNYGRDVLSRVAKLHFKTTHKIIES